MHPHINKLAAIAAKRERLIIGLMSGTSLDGLDIALCRCEGNGLSTKTALLQFSTIPYPSHFKSEILSVFSKKTASLEKICLLNNWVGLQHADFILQALNDWQMSSTNIDLVASHGQTIYHAPKFLHQHQGFGNSTLQIGDGDHIAYKTGIITVSDFRQKHIAAGGEGAPLAVYGDFLIFSDFTENRIMLNIGGIANFTFLPAGKKASEVFSTDTGPGNTMMDAFIQKHFPGKYFDEDAQLAKQGTIMEPLLTALCNHTFFSGCFPKTIGPELFNLPYLQQALLEANCTDATPENIMATLNAFSAVTIVEAIKIAIKGKEDYCIYVSGGGMHNPLLLQHIKNMLPGISIKSTNSLGVNPDAKEAVLFALLANECVSGGKQTPANPTQGIPAVTMGKISFPD